MFQRLFQLVQPWFERLPPAPRRPLQLEGLEARRLLSGAPALLPLAPLSAGLHLATPLDGPSVFGLAAGANLSGGGVASFQASSTVNLSEGPGLRSMISPAANGGDGQGLGLGAAVALGSPADAGFGLHTSIQGSLPAGGNQVFTTLGVTLGQDLTLDLGGTNTLGYLSAPKAGLTERLQVSLSAQGNPILEGGAQLRLNGDAQVGGNIPSLGGVGNGDLRLAGVVDLVFSGTGSTGSIPNSWEDPVPGGRNIPDGSQHPGVPRGDTTFPGPGGNAGPTRLAGVEAVTDVLFSTALAESIGGHLGDDVLLAMSSSLWVGAQAGLPPAPESPTPAAEAAGEPAGEGTGEAGAGEAAPQPDDGLADAAFDADSLEKGLARLLGQLGNLGPQWRGVLAGLEPYAWVVVVVAAALLIVRHRGRAGPSPGNLAEVAFAGFSGLAGLSAGEVS